MRQKRSTTMARVFVVVLGIAALASGVYVARKSGANLEAYGNDFNVYYHAAREVIGGRDPYQHSLSEWTPYLYLPLLAEAIVPLALLPLPVAAYVWFLIGAVSIVGAAWMSASLVTENLDLGAPKEHAGDSAIWRGAIALGAVALVLRFVLDTFNLGQVNGLVAALAVAHVYLYARDRKALSAAALILAVSIKLTPALLLVYHIAKLRLKYVTACAMLLVAVTALSFLPFGRSGSAAFQTFWNRTVRNEQGYDFAYSGNQSLRGAIARLTDPASTREGESRKPDDLATFLISIALLGIAVLAAVRTRSEAAGVAPFFCCLVLLSPLSWKSHYVMLIFPIAYLLTLPSKSRVSKSTKLLFLIAATLGATFVLFNLTSPRVIGLAAAEWVDEHSLVLAGALLILIACVVTSRFRDQG